jgi:hypothetical protein
MILEKVRALRVRECTDRRTSIHNRDGKDEYIDMMYSILMAACPNDRVLLLLLFIN